MTDKEFETKKRELELRLRIINIDQRRQYKNDEFIIFIIIAVAAFITAALGIIGTLI